MCGRGCGGYVEVVVGVCREKGTLLCVGGMSGCTVRMEVAQPGQLDPFNLKRKRKQSGRGNHKTCGC